MTVSNKFENECITKVYNEGLDELLGDPLLSELPNEVTLDEVKSVIALEQGQAMTVKVRKMDGEIYPIIISQGATVHELMSSIQRHVSLRQKRSGNIKNVSWKYVWSSFWLNFENEKLMDRTKRLKDYGIKNRSELTFTRRLNVK